MLAAAPPGGSIDEKVAIIAPMSPPWTAPLPVATATSTDGGCLPIQPSISFFFASKISIA